MWRGGPYELKTCPVRELDPEVDFYLDWFYATHHLADGGWVMQLLPAAGGVGVQDARLMQGLALVRDEANAFVVEQRADLDRDRRAQEHFDRVAREART